MARQRRAGKKDPAIQFDADPDDSDDDIGACWLPDDDGSVRLNKGKRAAPAPAAQPKPKAARKRPKR